MDLLVVCGKKAKEIEIDEKIYDKILENNVKTPLIINESETRRGMVGLFEVVSGKVRLMFSPFAEEIFKELENYDIVIKKNEEEILFFLILKTK